MQSTYLTELATAFAGMIANSEPNFLISRQVETAAIGFGKGVKRGAADNGVVATAGTAGDVFLGITCREHSKDADQFAVKEDALIMTKGVVWVVAAGAVANGAAVYIDSAGKFTSTVGTNTPVPNGRFDSSTSAADQLVKVRLS